MTVITYSDEGEIARGGARTLVSACPLEACFYKRWPLWRLANDI
jgi:hypothetical protein